MAIKLADTARPNNYVDAEHLGTFPVAYAEDVWFADGTRLSEKTFDGQSIQKEELPLASADELGNIYQYIGETGTYQHGCFYECKENSGEYSWQFLEVAGKIVYNAETPPKLIGDEISYSDGDVFVYSGDDAHGFLKGHHYKYMEDFTIDNINRVIFNLNSEHTTRRIAYMAESNIKVGTMLYVHYNNEEKYISGLSVVAIEEDIVTLWDESENSEITIEYGYSIEPTTDTAIVAFGYIDIGGGGGGTYQFSEDFVNEDNSVSLVSTQRIFTGTQAEWDALTTEVKTTYGQVNITDDESASKESIKDITNLLIQEAGYVSGNVYVKKIGHFVQLDFHSLVVSGYDLPTMSGFPKPIDHTNTFVLQGDGNPQTIGLAQISSGGILTSGPETAGLAPGTLWDGTVMYLTND